MALRATLPHCLPGVLACPQDDSESSIECVNEERRLHKKVCNVSYPFFRAKAKVGLGRGQGQEEGHREQGRERTRWWRGLPAFCV